MIYKDMFKRLPERFRKPNSEKIYEMLFSEYDEIQEVTSDIKDSRDIDNAFGETLDHLAWNVGVFRTREDDDLFRQMIKVGIIANLSKGDIETLNEVARLLLGDDFLGFAETWNNKTYADIAGLVGKIKFKLGRFPGILDRVTAGGVKLYWEATAVENIIKVRSGLSKGKSLYPLCNEWNAGTWHYQQNIGRIKNRNMAAKSSKRLQEFDYPETALIAASKDMYRRHEFAEQLSVEQQMIFKSIVRATEFDYVETDKILSGQYPSLMNDIKAILSKLKVSDRASVGEVAYPMCNQVTPGGDN